MVYHLSYARTYPAGVAKSYDRLLPIPLPELFCRRYGPMPPIREIRGQDGAWGSHLGQTRTIALADGGTMLETLTALDRPRTFAYTLSDITGPLRPLARRIRGRWEFASAGTGVRVTWSWDVEPAGRIGSLAEPLLRRLFRGYARQAFEEIEGVLLS